MGENKPNHLLEGSISKSIIMIALPVIFANILQTVYQLIDTFWVGRLGAESVAAVSLSFPIIFFLISLAMGLVMAASILVAQYNGKNDKENVSLVTTQTFGLILLVGTILSIVGFFSSEYILSFLTKDPIVLEQAASYLKISFLAIVAMFIYNLFQSSLRGVGEVKIPVIIISITVLLNFFLDPIFMFGWNFIPAMGVSGVALATLITEYLSAIIAVIFLIKGTYGVKLNLKDMIPRLVWVKKIFSLGIPSSLEMSSRSFGMLLMTFIVSTFGTLAIASYGIGTRILGFIIIPAIGFSLSTSSIVGNNLGARQHSRAEKIAGTGMKIGFWSLTAIGVLLFIFAANISSFFVPNEPELISMSSLFIKIMALSFGLIGIQMVVIGTFKAAGKMKTSMFLAVFQTFLLFFLSYLFALPLGLNELGIWIAYPTSNIIAVSVAFYFYKKKAWLKKEII
ncbi:MAG: MATE family efflux transporter [Nanoarchaeota archaeon]